MYTRKYLFVKWELPKQLYTRSTPVNYSQTMWLHWGIVFQDCMFPLRKYFVPYEHKKWVPLGDIFRTVFPLEKFSRFNDLLQKPNWGILPDYMYIVSSIFTVHLCKKLF